MKTTVEISDALLEAAKRTAHHDGVTLRSLLEAGLRRELAARQDEEPFRLRDASVDGRGLTPAFVEAGWDRFRDAAYEGHGGLDEPPRAS